MPHRLTAFPPVLAHPVESLTPSFSLSLLTIIALPSMHACSCWPGPVCCVQAGGCCCACWCQVGQDTGLDPP